jgi:hypothetical protein
MCILRSPARSCHTIGAVWIAFVAVLLPRPAAAGPIERLVWSALRFHQQAELRGDASEAMRLPFSTINMRYDDDRFPMGRTMGISPGFQGTLSPHDLIYFETPIVLADWDERSPRIGLGDFLLEYQRVLYATDDDDGRGLEALALSFDLITPTGSVENGVGNGAWVIYPSLTGLFQLTETLTLVPTAGYLHSLGQVYSRPLSVGRPKSERVGGDARVFQVGVNLIQTFDNGTWFLVSPDFSYDLESDQTTLELRAGFGVPLSQSSTVGVQFAQHLGGPAAAERSISISFSRFF